MAEPTRIPDEQHPAHTAPEETRPWLKELPPRKIVAELARNTVGEEMEKKAVALAVRNSWCRSHATGDIRDELLPDNSILNRAARPSPLSTAPSPGDKVEGRGEKAPLFVVSSKGDVTPKALEGDVEAQERRRRTREKLRQQLKDGKLEERDVEVEVQQEGFPMLEMMQPPQGMEGTDMNLTEWLKEMLPKKKKRRTVHLDEARRILIDEELKKLVDMDDVVNEALDRVENHGVIFIDEIDKITGTRGQTTGPDVSREGVQRDLLPIVEGSTVQTRYGYVRTDHVLFIAAGAFHIAKPSDLIPELQGRFPIRVELSSLTEAEFVRIMTEPE